MREIKNGAKSPETKTGLNNSSHYAEAAPWIHRAEESEIGEGEDIGSGRQLLGSKKTCTRQRGARRSS